MKYTHLSEKERIQLETYLSENYSMPEIAQKLGRNKSTISREISRDTNKRGTGAKVYSAQKAQSKYRKRLKGKRGKEVFPFQVKKEARSKLEDKWSPELISGRAKMEGRDLVSHEAIYTWAYEMQRSNKRGHREFKDLWRHLAHAGRQRRKRSRAHKQRGIIPNRAPVDKRPEPANNRGRKGHFEAGLIIGKKHRSGLPVMTGRKLGYTFIRRTKAKGGKYICKKIQRIVEDNQWIKSITFDNDPAFSEHEKIPVDTYFTRPYCSQDKGSVGNKNKAVRMKYPKGFDFNMVTDQKIVQLQKWTNQRPMKMFNFKSPKELFEKAFRGNVALVS